MSFALETSDIGLGSRETRLDLHVPDVLIGEGLSNFGLKALDRSLQPIKLELTQSRWRIGACCSWRAHRL